MSIPYPWSDWIILPDALRNLNERATAQQLEQIAKTLQNHSDYYCLVGDDAKEYMLKSLWLIGIKQRKRLVKGIWADLAKRIPNAVAFDQGWEECPTITKSVSLYKEECTRELRCLYWACAICLARNPDPTPATFPELLEWSGFAAYKNEKAQQTAEAFKRFSELLKGTGPAIQDTTADRKRLGLPLDTPLTEAAISRAFRQKAKTFHPDMGGSTADFTYLTRSKDRLLRLVQA